ncbi:MAG TPA: GntR family transcriptional regulator [Spirochaetota bacterium]|nr:GntR family transcriptional regulator [Spirochaetota bacterium]HOK93571.1 GntR family transcriptional regulator [Spirochaetota bacterium]HON16337.1 GntR family transcriptional regulator [Spirochaetota bacterium]HPP96159.1 GntR family transcriptional regulator [Spirochaetota bacterium]HRS64005.1 GntR family transcriptional regulator [Spirochaetota bacterium]
MKERLASKIFSELEKDILTGRYEVNSKLPPERELAERFNTSRFVIREAIAMLINAGLAETRPQSGTYIKNFYDDTSLDALIKIIQTTKKMELRTYQSLMNYKATNDVANIERAAEEITQEELEVIETLILKKKLNKSPHVLAECDYMIDNEIAKAARNIISLAVTISLKPLKVFVAEMLYKLTDCRDVIIENDIKVFEALSERNSEKAVAAMKERHKVINDIVMEHAVIENGFMYVKEDYDNLKKNVMQFRDEIPIYK